MKRVTYIAGPMSKGNRYTNIQQADEAMAELMKLGYSVINPILSFFAGGAGQDFAVNVTARAVHGETGRFKEFSHSDWLDMDFGLVAVSHAVLRLPGESKGADMETAFAESKGIPVFTDIDRLHRHFQAIEANKPKELDWSKVSKWDRRFIELAMHVAGWSRDPSTRVGACIVDQSRRVVSVGFNGFARGCNDAPELYDDREIKYSRVVHAEVNSILFAGRDLTGCTLYTTPFSPCSRCAGIVIQAGIKRVVAPAIPADKAERWAKDMAMSAQQFVESDVQLDFIPWK